MTDVIQSPHNPILKRVRSLGHRKTRYAERAFMLEGVRAFSAAIEAGIEPVATLVADDASPEILALAGSWRPRLVERRLFNLIMDTDTPQGIAAIAPMPAAELPDVAAPLIVALDGIGDPGNLGTIVRSAAAAGADGIVLGPGCVDPYNAKTVRSAMGALFTIPVWEDGADADGWLRERCPSRLLAAGDGEQCYDAPLWRGGVAMIVGSEAHGASAWGRNLATGGVRIPLTRAVESLNAAVAASILLFEAQRQRQPSGAV